MKPVLALTMGDPAGIGPEILVASLKNHSVQQICAPIAVGSREVLWRAGWRPNLSRILDSGRSCRVRPGRPNAEGGAAGFAAVRLSFDLAARRLVSGIVTAPISKEHWAAAGIKYPDHTDFLKEASRSRRVAMMLLAGKCRTVLVTRHMPLREAVGRITVPAVLEAAELAHAALRDQLNITKPRLGVCALNPHAGEHGILGGEERKTLIPAISQIRKKGIRISDPIPADSAWAMSAAGEFDGLLTLYHDQALIPLKVLNRYGIVNWTIGIPVIRTSPGHGTAFDIAGKNKAKPDAMIAAVCLAAQLARR